MSTLPVIHSSRDLVGPRGFTQLAALSLVALMLAGCSNAKRFDAFSNPFEEKVDRAATATIPRIPNGKLPSRTATSTYSSAPLSAPISSQAAAPIDHETNAVLSKAPVASGQGFWSATGGTPIVAAQGESADMLARRYGVPEDALLRVNGFNNPQQIQPGTRLIVPVFSASSGSPVYNHPNAAPVSMASTKKPVVQKPVVQEQKLASQLTKKSLLSRPPKAPDLPAKTVAKLPQPVVTVPTKNKVVAATVPSEDLNASKLAKGAKTARLAPIPEKTKVAETPPVAAVDKDIATGSLHSGASASAESNDPEFRWPAHGHIIQGFKAGANDGINIALPEGTAVKAVEGGVVAYSGNGVKGYGNLVLIRHPNGFVSAYANNGDVAVKRGEMVKRGQTIAKSGQSGNVASPQLHFELRKGETPVDPTKYLAGL